MRAVYTREEVRYITCDCSVVNGSIPLISFSGQRYLNGQIMDPDMVAMTSERHPTSHCGQQTNQPRTTV